MALLDDTSFFGFMKIHNTVGNLQGLFINLDEKNSSGYKCPLSFDASPKTPWLLSPVHNYTSSDNCHITISCGDFNLDIFDSQNPKLMGWKPNENNNQMFTWRFENDYLILSHDSSKDNIGLEGVIIPELIVEIVDIKMN